MTDVSAARQRAERALRWCPPGKHGLAPPFDLEALARDVVRLADRVEAAEKERDEAHFAHLALDDFNVPREEPHFRSPYKLAGRIRWLRSTLVIGGNQRAGALIDRAVAAEARVAELETELRRELWLGHGHPYAALYGDDGEMQCTACPCDFKRQPIAEVRQAALVARAALSPVSPNTEETK